MRHRVRAVCLLAEDIHLSDSEIAQQVQILHDPANFTEKLEESFVCVLKEKL